MRRALLAATLAAFALLILATVAVAQTPVATPQHRIAWDQVAPDLAAAQGYGYWLVVDGVKQPATAPGGSVTCTGAASPFTCSIPFPSVTPGDHTLALTASVTVDGKVIESAPSPAISFRMVIAPTAPTNVRIE